MWCYVIGLWVGMIHGPKGIKIVFVVLKWQDWVLLKVCIIFLSRKILIIISQLIFIYSSFISHLRDTIRLPGDGKWYQQQI